MNIIADENVYQPIIDYLKAQGHKVINVRYDGLSGSSDNNIYIKLPFIKN